MRRKAELELQLITKWALSSFQANLQKNRKFFSRWTFFPLSKTIELAYPPFDSSHKSFIKTHLLLSAIQISMNTMNSLVLTLAFSCSSLSLSLSNFPSLSFSDCPSVRPSLSCCLVLFSLSQNFFFIFFQFLTRSALSLSPNHSLLFISLSPSVFVPHFCSPCFTPFLNLNVSFYTYHSFYSALFFHCLFLFFLPSAFHFSRFDVFHTEQPLQASPSVSF